MFQDYLINVVMTAAPLWMMALIMFVLGFIYVRNKAFTEFWAPIKAAVGLVVIAGLIIGMSSRANTYKNTVDYNRVQDQARIEQLQESRQPAPIVDRSLQPLTDEALQDRSVDMRERVQLSTGNDQ